MDVLGASKLPAINKAFFWNMFIDGIGSPVDRNTAAKKGIEYFL
jgi:hypothetical protein